MTQKFVLQDFNLGGISDSDYQGTKNSLASIVGFDLHQTPGILKVSQKLTKEAPSSGFFANSVDIIIPCSDGKTYLFANNAIWERTSAGVYSIVRTNTQGKTLGACEYNGYIYYATSTKLGRWEIGADWSTATDAWQTFTVGDTAYKPMVIKNLVLYIGDGNLVAQVEDGVFTADALDLEEQYRVSALGEYGHDLLIGTYVNDNVSLTQIFRWNTWSVSWSYEDPIPEIGINSFLKTDNVVLVQAGTKGNIYAYDGQRLVPFKRIKGDWSGTKKAVVKNNAVANYNGIPLFGLSNSSGNPAIQGVYSFASFSSNYPRVLSIPHIVSSEYIADLTINAIAVVGDSLLVSWSKGTEHAIDKIDFSNKEENAYIETRIINFDRTELKDFSISVGYASLPENCSIVIKKKENYGSWVTVESVNDTERKIQYSDVRSSACSVIQFRIECVVSGNTAPEIESLTISF